MAPELVESFNLAMPGLYRVRPWVRTWRRLSLLWPLASHPLQLLTDEMNMSNLILAVAPRAVTPCQASGAPIGSSEKIRV